MEPKGRRYKGETKIFNKCNKTSRTPVIEKRENYVWITQNLYIIPTHLLCDCGSCLRFLLKSSWLRSATWYLGGFHTYIDSTKPTFFIVKSYKQSDRYINTQINLENITFLWPGTLTGTDEQGALHGVHSQVLVQAVPLTNICLIYSLYTTIFHTTMDVQAFANNTPRILPLQSILNYNTIWLTVRNALT